MTIDWDNKNTESLAEAVLVLRSKNEAKRFLRDLLTEEEIMEFGNRWQAAQMLDSGFSYTEIRGKTGLSPRTVARISSWLKKGKGGYRLVLDRMNKHHKPHPAGKGLR